jgi:hypothetical protein
LAAAALEGGVVREREKARIVVKIASHEKSEMPPMW